MTLTRSLLDPLIRSSERILRSRDLLQRLNAFITFVNPFIFSSSLELKSYFDHQVCEESLLIVIEALALDGQIQELIYLCFGVKQKLFVFGRLVHIGWTWQLFTLQVLNQGVLIDRWARSHPGVYDLCPHFIPQGFVDEGSPSLLGNRFWQFFRDSSLDRSSLLKRFVMFWLVLLGSNQ